MEETLPIDAKIREHFPILIRIRGQKYHKVYVVSLRKVYVLQVVVTTDNTRYIAPELGRRVHQTQLGLEIVILLLIRQPIPEQYFCELSSKRMCCWRRTESRWSENKVFQYEDIPRLANVSGVAGSGLVHRSRQLWKMSNTRDHCR